MVLYKLVISGDVAVPRYVQVEIQAKRFEVHERWHGVVQASSCPHVTASILVNKIGMDDFIVRNCRRNKKVFKNKYNFNSSACVQVEKEGEILTCALIVKDCSCMLQVQIVVHQGRIQSKAEGGGQLIIAALINIQRFVTREPTTRLLYTIISDPNY